MGLFKKEETTHFERDAGGRVVKVIKNGEELDPRYKSSEQLEREYRESHPTRWQSYKQRREKEREIYKKHYAEAREKRIIRQAKQAGSITPVQRIEKLSRGLSFNPPSKFNANPFGSLFDTGMSRPRASKKTPKSQRKKYTVVKGKAYPIVGTGKKKKKRSGSKTKTSVGGFDLFDNHGFM